MRLAIVAGFAALLFTTTSAQAGFGCQIEDSTVTFSLTVGITTGVGSMFSADAWLTSTLPDVAGDLQEQNLTRADVIQFWQDDKRLYLELYRERDMDDPYGYTRLVIMTDAVDEGTYQGTYGLAFYDTEGKTDLVQTEGSIECFSD